MELSIEVYRDNDNTYVASCPKLHVYSYGETLNKAVSRMREIINFYIESANELGISLEELCGASIEMDEKTSNQQGEETKERKVN